MTTHKFIGHASGAANVSLFSLLVILFAIQSATGSERLLVLSEQGEVAALKGYITYLPGKVLAVEGDHAYSPYAPNAPRRIPTSGEVIGIDDCGKMADGELLPGDWRPPGETAIVAARGALSQFPQTTVVITQRQKPGSHGLDNQLAPTFIRVVDGSEMIGGVEIDTGALPCAVILDNLDGMPGNEIAFIWASVAAGYTLGVTIFSAN